MDDDLASIEDGVGYDALKLIASVEGFVGLEQGASERRTPAGIVRRQADETRYLGLPGGSRSTRAPFQFVEIRPLDACENTAQTR